MEEDGSEDTVRDQDGYLHAIFEKESVAAALVYMSGGLLH